MKKINIKILLILTLSILFIMLPVYVHAAGSFSITGSASLTTGDAKTITVSATGCAGQFSISSSNSSVVTVNPSSVWLDNSSSSITITAKGAGTATIKITATDVTDTELNDVTGSKSCTVTVTAPKPAEPETPTQPTTPSDNNTTKPSNNNTTTKPSGNTTKPAEAKKSSNSKLAKLEIAEGTISPEFSSDITEYTISLPNEIEKLSIAASPDHSKATFSINGNETLNVGENNIEIVVKAEDGSETKYKILATRADKELSLSALSIYYINEKGQNTALPIEPTFSFDTYEYTLEKLSHEIKEIKIETTANKENAKIEITGNEELKTGKNTIQIKVTLTKEDEQEEQKIYTITVEKEEEPVTASLTAIDKIGKWFQGIGQTIGSWISTNFQNIINVMLIISAAGMIGLTIYYIQDYKNYQKLLAKLAEYNKENLMERANVALNPEMAINNEQTDTETIKPNNEQAQKQSQEIEEAKEEKKEVRLGRGRRFRE